MRKGCIVKGSSLVSRHDSLVCPLCEAGELQRFGNDSMRCESCGGHVSGAMLEILRQITALPDALGEHACEECGYPQMRLLPDGTFHCPSCGSEVLPLGAPLVDWKSGEHAEAYWCGWIDGRYGKPGSLTENRQLAKWQDPSERLDYYRGHRAGGEARRTAMSARVPKVRRRRHG
jgi:ribosomal protein L37AE/L43A